MDVPVIGMNKMAFDELHSVKDENCSWSNTSFEEPESY
jgi:hypothetical protein